MIQTHSGKWINPLEITADDLVIEDIACSLSKLCRYNGHIDRFYSVAEHCIVMAIHFMERGEESLAFAALMHDCAEAYIGDIPRPIKDQLPAIASIEHNILEVASQKYGFAYPLPPEIIAADDAILWDEQLILVGRDIVDWGITEDPLVVEIRELSPGEAERAFLSLFMHLEAKK